VLSQRWTIYPEFCRSHVHYSIKVVPRCMGNDLDLRFSLIESKTFDLRNIYLMP